MSFCLKKGHDVESINRFWLGYDIVVRPHHLTFLFCFVKIRLLVFALSWRWTNDIFFLCSLRSPAFL